jgi:hypothetical protein
LIVARAADPPSGAAGEPTRQPSGDTSEPRWHFSGGPSAPKRKFFRLAWPPWQPPGSDGLAAIVSPGASTAWADGLLARDNDGLVVWAATSTHAETQALARLLYPGVRAVTLAPAKGDPRRVRLGLELAIHLAAIRRNGSAVEPACLTSWSPPRVPPDVVRIPHLVTIQRDGAVTDTVVWELATLASAQHWLGGPLPDLAFFEAHLDALLRLRGAARRAQLPATAVAVGLADLLRNRDLSIRLVYERAAMFRTLLAGYPRGETP